MSHILAAGAARMKLEAENYESRIAALEAQLARAEARVDELEKALPFVVQYRRTDAGVRWIDMAAFDTEGPAERYCQACAETTLHWEYRNTRRDLEGGKANG